MEKKYCFHGVILICIYNYIGVQYLDQFDEIHLYFLSSCSSSL